MLKSVDIVGSSSVDDMVIPTTLACLDPHTGEKAIEIWRTDPTFHSIKWWYQQLQNVENVLIPVRDSSTVLARLLTNIDIYRASLFRHHAARREARPISSPSAQLDMINTVGLQ
jgi:hypothetical protein